MSSSQGQTEAEFFSKLQDLINVEKDPDMKAALIRSQLGFLDDELQKCDCDPSLSKFYMEYQWNQFLGETENLIDAESNSLTAGVVGMLKAKGFTLADARNNNDFLLDDFDPLTLFPPEESTDTTVNLGIDDPEDFFEKFRSFSAELDMMNDSLEVSKSFTTPKVTKVSEPKAFEVKKQILRITEQKIIPNEVEEERHLAKRKSEPETNEIKNFGFTSARYELMVQQNKKNGGKPIATETASTQAPLFAYGISKKTLGGRRGGGGRNPFVPPVRSNSCE